MKLTTKWNKFKSEILSLIEEADDLLYYERDNIKQNDCILLQKKIENWINESLNYLKKSFDSPQNEFAENFENAKANKVYFKNLKDNVIESLNGALDELNSKKKTLEYFIQILSVSDAIIQPNFIDLETRALYTQNEIKDLILDKLYYLYNHNYYPVHEIVKGNGIMTSRFAVNEILDELESKGLVRVINSAKVLVQLSLKGKEFIDNKRNFDFIENNRIIEPQVKKIQENQHNIHRLVKAETIYHYFDRQLAS